MSRETVDLASTGSTTSTAHLVPEPAHLLPEPAHPLPGPVEGTRPSSLKATARLVSLLARPTLADRGAWALPVTALAVASALSLTVAGGVRWFWTTTGQLAGLYRMLSIVALVLLVVPLATLAAAAARLSTTRRDTRLSSLRLLGATARTLRLVTLAENAATALAGALVGVVAYLALMPVVGLLHFNGTRIGAGGLWLGVLPLLGAVLGIVVLVLVSSAFGLRKVVVEPLGVRTRQQPPRARTWRVVAGVGAIAAASVMARMVGSSPSMVVMGAVLVAMFALPLLAVDVMGPWVVSRQARHDLRRARGPVQLLAARTVLENPKQAWRQVGALSVASFVAVFAGTAIALTSSQARTDADRMLNADIRTGVLLTLGICFLTVAFGVGINQTSAVLDRRGLFVGLDMVGMPASVIDGARRRAVLRPMLLVVALGVVSGLLLVLPMGAAAKTASATSLLVVAGIVVAGVGLVWVALQSTRVALRQVLDEGVARVE